MGTSATPVKKWSFPPAARAALATWPEGEKREHAWNTPLYKFHVSQYTWDKCVTAGYLTRVPGANSWERHYVRTAVPVKPPRPTTKLGKEARQARYAKNSPFPCSLHDHWELVRENPVERLRTITDKLSTDDGKPRFYDYSYRSSYKLAFPKIPTTNALHRWRDILLDIFQGKIATGGDVADSSDTKGRYLDNEIRAWLTTGESMNLLLAMMMLDPVFEDDKFVRFNKLSVADAQAKIAYLLEDGGNVLSRYRRYVALTAKEVTNDGCRKDEGASKSASSGVV
jgi:hypothetical protein